MCEEETVRRDNYLLHRDLRITVQVDGFWMLGEDMGLDHNPERDLFRSAYDEEITVIIRDVARTKIGGWNLQEAAIHVKQHP